MNRDIPPGAMAAFTNLVNLPDVRRAHPLLRRVEKSQLSDCVGAKSRVYSIDTSSCSCPSSVHYAQIGEVLFVIQCMAGGIHFLSLAVYAYWAGTIPMVRRSHRYAFGSLRPRQLDAMVMILLLANPV